MPRGGNRCTHRPVRYEFLEVLVDFARAHKGSTPTHVGWWQLVRQAGHTLSFSAFRSHTFKLADEDLVVFVDGVICLRHGEWKRIDKDGNVLSIATGDALDSPRAKEELEAMRGIVKARRGARVAKRRATTGGSDFSSHDVLDLLKLQNHRCWWCGEPLPDDYHIDHRVPLARGGTNAVGNICLACPKCNIKKGDKMPWEFCGRLL